MIRRHEGIGSIGLFAAVAALFVVAPACQSNVTSTANNNASEAPLVEGDGAEACMGGVIGDGITCVPPDQIKIQSYDACLAAGLALAELVLDDPICANGGSAHTTYTCCPAPPLPPQDPNACTVETFGDGVTCLSPEEWKVQLAGGANGVDADVCAADGRVLADISLFHEARLTPKSPAARPRRRLTRGRRRATAPGSATGRRVRRPTNGRRRPTRSAFRRGSRSSISASPTTARTGRRATRSSSAAPPEVASQPRPARRQILADYMTSV
jgi:hypothetical protein